MFSGLRYDPVPYELCRGQAATCAFYKAV